MNRHLSNLALETMRGRRRKRAQDDGEGNSDSDSDAFPVNDEVAGAILKRPENLKGETRRSRTPPNEVDPLRFPSLSDLGNVWPLRESEAAIPSRVIQYDASTEVCDDGKGIGYGMGVANDKVCDQEGFKRTFVWTDDNMDQTSS
jgi:hypothetical protein